MPEIHGLGTLTGTGRILILTGIFLAVLGALFLLAAKIPGIGRLPGDILIHKKGFSFYFPVTTSILASIIISLLLWLLGRR